MIVHNAFRCSVRWISGRVRGMQIDSEKVRVCMKLAGDSTNGQFGVPTHKAPDTDFLREVAKNCSRFQQLAKSTPGLAACVLWLEDWSDVPPSAVDAHMTFLAEQKRRFLCRRYGFPASRAFLNFFENWDECPERSGSHLWLLQVLISLKIEPDTETLLGCSLRPSLSDIKRILFGGVSQCAEYFSRTHLLKGKCDWFFALPAARRHFLAQTWETLLIYYRIESRFLPRLRLLSSFPNEKKALGYLQQRIWLLEQIRPWIVELMGQIEGGNLWPHPPLPGDEHIHPITSKAELHVEGEELSHCIGSYDTRVLLGEFFAYRMVSPVRCTVGIKGNGNHWQLDDIRSHGNQRVTDAGVREIVQDWLERNAWGSNRPSDEQSTCWQKEIRRRIESLNRKGNP